MLPYRLETQKKGNVTEKVIHGFWYLFKELGTVKAVFSTPRFTLALLWYHEGTTDLVQMAQFQSCHHLFNLSDWNQGTLASISFLLNAAKRGLSSAWSYYFAELCCMRPAVPNDDGDRWQVG